MSAISKGLLSGFIATVVLTIAMVLKAYLHIVSPEYSVMNLLGRISGGDINAWVDHFIIGTALWGLVYIAFDGLLPESWPSWLKGAVFGVFAWLLMMLVFMPVAHVGLFGNKLGILAAAVPLIQHLIYGVAIGVTFGLLTRFFPEQEAAEQQPVVRKAKATA
jgi:hypothetical protein